MTGSLLVGVACLCAATRWEAARPPVRGPGRWVEIDSERAFGARRKFRGVSAGPHAMYVRCFLGVGAFAAIALAARGASSQSAWLAAVDSAVLVPLFVTSWPAGTYPEGVQGSDRWLLAVYARLRAYRAHLTTLCGRIVGDGSVDEVRVQVVPRLALPGLLGIEIGRAWSATEVGWSAYPEVLVRMLRESETAKKLRRLAPEALPILGRNPDERVVRLLPCAPTHGATVALARRLSAELAYPVGARPANMG